MTCLRSSTYGRTRSSRCVLTALTAAAKGTRLTSAFPLRSSSLARRWTPPVTSVSAGPPLGGLYLKPPSSGGLCDGVTTMPSARPAWAGRSPGGARGGGGGAGGWGAPAEDRRPAVGLGGAVAADRRRRGQDVGLVEGPLECRSAVARGPERDP